MREVLWVSGGVWEWAVSWEAENRRIDGWRSSGKKASSVEVLSRLV